ncbi:DNA methyltransferase [Pseudonocardia alni]|uniref:DNA methyltransferase n=1 Tax=Pseudonocardia alni TaxID=33907 RepID=UPI00386AD4B6
MDHDRPLRSRLSNFVRYRNDHLSGDEKGEAQIYLDALFRALGFEGLRQAGATLEQRLKKDDARGTAFADLMWKPRCLIEMKKAGVDLNRVYRQAFDYWIRAVPDRPRYVILCNFDEFWIYDFDQQLDSPMDKIALADLPQRWEALAFLLPEPEAPSFGNDLVAVTRHAAATVAGVFRQLHERGIDRTTAQHFVLQSVMAMFAEDIGLLPGHFFTRALDDSRSGRDAYDYIFGLFREMNSAGITAGGRYRGTPYFNGGLFNNVIPIELENDELGALRAAAATNWSAVRPEIFGTLFEQSMDARERHAYGAHFTSQADIARIVIPTIVDPFREKLAAAGSIADIERILNELYAFRVLDPACGSGNFLYVAYREMRRLEHEALTLIRERRRARDLAQTGLAYVTPDHFLGIDRNDFAVEVAKVTMMLGKKLAADELDDDQQVLPLDNLNGSIIASDALFSPWPRADAIIGNPPFLGRRWMVDQLGASYVSRLQDAYPRISGVSDFVCYWFPLAHDALADGGRAGFVATNSIRDTSSRAASLDYIVDNDGVITEAVSSKPWSGDATVHVSIINWIKSRDPLPGKRTLWLNETELRLDVDVIPSSLSPGVDTRKAVPLSANQKPKVCFQGQTPGVTEGFTLDADERADLIRQDAGSARYIHPFATGDNLLHALVYDRFIIDLPHRDVLEAERDAPALMRHLREHVLPVRQDAARKQVEQNEEQRSINPRFKPRKHHINFLDYWWMLSYRRTDMVEAVSRNAQYIATARVSTEDRPSVFTLVDSSVRPADIVVALPFDDAYTLGVLHSSLHRKWLEARCSHLGTGLRYTSTTVFDTFPWPQTVSSDQVKRIEAVVGEILALRNRNRAAGMTLARQYDSLRSPGRSALRSLHERLDVAVREAYGFSEEDDVVAQMLALNLDLSDSSEAVQGPGPISVPAARL